VKVPLLGWISRDCSLVVLVLDLDLAQAQDLAGGHVGSNCSLANCDSTHLEKGLLGVWLLLILLLCGGAEGDRLSSGCDAHHCAVEASAAAAACAHLDFASVDAVVVVQGGPLIEEVRLATCACRVWIKERVASVDIDGCVAGTLGPDERLNVLESDEETVGYTTRLLDNNR